MSGQQRRSTDEIFKTKFTTEFVRVPQSEEESVRHPGVGSSLLKSPKTPNPQYDSTCNPFDVRSVTSHSSSSDQISRQDDVLSCPVCKAEYDTVIKRPVLLPGCGHTFCSACVRDRTATGLECPICRRSYPGASLESLPINFSLETLLVNKKGGMATLQRFIKEQSGEKPAESLCPTHGIRLSFWCRSCDKVACGECLFDEHPASDGHTLAKLQDVANEIRKDAISTISVSHSDATAVFSRYLKNFVGLLENLHEAGRLMQTSRKLLAATQCAEDFNSVTAVYETIKKVNSQIVELKLGSEEEEDTKATANLEGEELKIVEVSTEEGELKKTVEGILDELDDISKGMGGEQKVTKVEEKKSSAVKPRDVTSSNGTVFAMHTDGRLSKVQTEERGLHVYSLSQYSSGGYSVAVRLGLLLEFVQDDKVTVFLDFNHGDTKLGRVYIELKEGMRRSTQFLHLCLGTLGPTYKGCRMDGVSEKGAPGEYLRTGDYTGQGGQGGVGVVEGLEWGDKWTDTKKAGQVCGVGGDAGERRFGALFVLCTSSNSQDTFRCPFGSVVQGMEVLQQLTKREPVEGSYISDCGAVIPVEED